MTNELKFKPRLIAKSYNDIANQKERMRNMNKARRSDQDNRVEIIIRACQNARAARWISIFTKIEDRNIKH